MSRMLKQRSNSISDALALRAGTRLLLGVALSALYLLPYCPWNPCALVNSAVAAETIQLETLKVESFKSHSRLVIVVDDTVGYEWKNSAKNFTLLLRGIGFADLGVPLGEEERWVSSFRDLKDSRLQSLTIKELREGLRIEGRWKYPSGVLALADPRMETFEYREKGPSRLLVDFWHKKGPSLQEVRAEELKAQRAAQTRKDAAAAQARANRRIATQKTRSEADDLGRFCRRPLGDSTDVFLPFFPVHEKVNFERWISPREPDSDYSYYEPENKEGDAKYVRLALSLYRENKFALVLRTLDFLDAEHPRSSYQTEMKFLRANTYLKLGMEKEGEDTLSKLMMESPKSPAALHGAMYIAGKRAKSDSQLAALESFLWLAEHHSEHRLAWLFHLGAAEALYGLKQVERATKEYQWVAEHATDRSNQAEGALRMGDLHLDRFQYEDALADYHLGLTHFRKEAEKFPTVHLNRGETLYWLGQYAQAKKSFQEFLEKFPSHPSGWRAAYRLGEIAGRAGDSSSRQWFLDTVNRYPLSPGATLARLRLLSCGDHGGFDVDGGKRFLEGEAAQFSGAGEVLMIRYPEFRAVTWARSLVEWSKEVDAIDAMIRDMSVVKRPETRAEMASMLEVLFRRRIKALLSEGKKPEALAFYQEKSAFLPKNLRYTDPEYLLRLSEAASDLRLGKLGGELADAYREAVAPPKNREPAVADPAGADADPSQRLRVSEQKFAEAKSLWVSGHLNDKDNGIEKVRALLAEVGESSPFSFEREIILGLIADRQKKTNEALAHLAKAQLLRTAGKKGASELRLQSWMVRLEAQGEDLKGALELGRKLEEELRVISKRPATAAATNHEAHVAAANGEAKDDVETLNVLGAPSLLTLGETIQIEAEILEKQEAWADAAQAYARAIDAEWGGNRVKFAYARALRKTGEAENQAKGIAILKELAAAKEEDLWKRLAAESLASVDLLSKKSPKDGNNKPEIAKEGTK